jgi:fructose-1,6-bisphosphatase I
MKDQGMRLMQFLQEQEGARPDTNDGFGELISQIGLAGKIIAREVARAGLVGKLGLTGAVNVQNEAVQKLDVFANETFLRILQNSQLVCMVASEEMEKPIPCGQKGAAGKYIVLFDPLDGSSNISVDGTLGSIFSIHLAQDPVHPDPSADILKKGSEQVAAGYLIYGPSTLMIYTSGKRVHGFTLDTSIGEFYLSHEHIQIPFRGNTYSVNHGNYHDWLPEIQAYINHLLKKEPSGGRPYSLRYVGTLVADLHRTLINGGIFLYPGSQNKPEGKLRLLYEVAPMALLIEAAGGKATEGRERILDIRPSELHQRTPVIIGSPQDVEEATEFLRKK